MGKTIDNMNEQTLIHYTGTFTQLGPFAEILQKQLQALASMMKYKNPKITNT